MLKFIAAFLATCAVLFVLLLVVGPRLWGTALTVPHFGWNLSWAAIAFGGVLFATWRIVKGK